MSNGPSVAVLGAGDVVVTRRQLTVVVLVTSALLALCLCSYVYLHHEQMVMKAHLRQVMRDCRCCRETAVDADSDWLTQPFSPGQINSDVSEARTTSQMTRQLMRRRRETASQLQSTNDDDDDDDLPQIRRRHTTSRRTGNRRRPKSKGHTGTGKKRRRNRPQSSSGRLNSIIHLAMHLPAINDSDRARLYTNSSPLIDVDFGKMHRRGFVPSADRRQQSNLVYRVWRVANWAQNFSSNFSYHEHSGSVQILTSGLYLIYGQMNYQCGRLCGYTLMHNETPLARCVTGRRSADPDNLAVGACSSVTAAVLRRGDRLRLQDVGGANTEQTERYVHVTISPEETAATNFWGVLKLTDLSD